MAGPDTSTPKHVSNLPSTTGFAGAEHGLVVEPTMRTYGTSPPPTAHYPTEQGKGKEAVASSVRGPRAAPAAPLLTWIAGRGMLTLSTPDANAPDVAGQSTDGITTQGKWRRSLDNRLCVEGGPKAEVWT